MAVFYRTPLNRLALHLMRSGPTCYTDCGAGKPGSAVLLRLAAHGLAKEIYRVQGPTGGQPRVYYGLTEAGWEVALLPSWASVGRPGECCEEAILGIEGDHAPYCPF